ncbi:MAG TPA: YgaP-like transmembrane domain, partial [Gemmatimonadales bacterium]|nr:YgaP-like transmembrane domain [Gemmatimonadales bacterium]
MADAFEGVAAPDRWGGGYAANLGSRERIASAVAGAAMLGTALSRKSAWRWVLIPTAAGLFWRAATGRCPVKAAFQRGGLRPSGGHTSPVSSVARGEGVKVERRITVDRPAAELYRYWHNLENLPQFMKHLESVTVLDDQ